MNPFLGEPVDITQEELDLVEELINEGYQPRSIALVTGMSKERVEQAWLILYR